MRRNRCPARESLFRDFAKEIDQPIKMNVERLGLAESNRGSRHQTSPIIIAESIERVGQRIVVVCRGNHEALNARRDDLARTICFGSYNRKPAGKGFEDDKRAGVVIAWQDKGVASMEGRPNVWREANEMNLLLKSQCLDFPSISGDAATPAYGKMDGTRFGIPAGSKSKRLDQGIESLEPEIMSNEEHDKIIVPQSEPRPKRLTSSSGIVNLQSRRIDRVWNDADPISRDSVIPFKMPLDESTHRNHPSRSAGFILPVFDVEVKPVLWVRTLGNAIKRPTPALWEAKRIMSETGRMHSPLGNDHVMMPCVDESHRAVERCGSKRILRVSAKAQDPCPTGPTCRGDQDNSDFGGDGALCNVGGIKINSMTTFDQPSTKVGDVGLSTTSRRIDVLIVDREMHGNLMGLA